MNTRAPLVVAALLAAPLLAGCGGSGGSGGSDSAAPAAAQAGGAGDVAGVHSEAVVPGAERAGAEPGRRPGAGTPARPAVQTRAVISTGQLEIATAQVERARLGVLHVVDGLGGLVSDEQSTGDHHGRADAVRLVLRVPSDDFEAAMGQLGKQGSVLSRSTSSQDVTTQVIDNHVRIRAQRESLRRVEQLLAKAKTIGQVVSIESQLTRRQKQLDSLEAQQSYLADQTSLSTISVYLHRPANPPNPGVHHRDDTGFLAGFRSGLDGLTTVTVGLLTVVGALLPFVLVVGVFGWPAWLLVRRTRRTATPS